MVSAEGLLFGTDIDLEYVPIMFFTPIRGNKSIKRFEEAE
jgi:hypothetical protein